MERPYCTLKLTFTALTGSFTIPERERRVELEGAVDENSIFANLPDDDRGRQL